MANETLGHCETCKHWMFDESDWEFADLKVGDCKAVRQREDITGRAVEHLEDRWADEAERLKREAMLAAKAFVVDGSGYFAALRTRPDFGCVLHDPKEPT